jgi:hypothetical protein
MPLDATPSTARDELARLRDGISAAQHDRARKGERVLVLKKFEA